MDTVIVTNNQFYSHYPKRIPKGTVNAEHVEIRLDSEWGNLTIRIHWLNVASGVEKVVLLDRDKPNTIPWEVLTDLGELRMGLVGLDGETVIKPTIWLTYGYVSDGVDPESGSDPQPPTPSWEQQMVALAEAAANAAKAAKETADNLQAAAESGEFDGDPGPAGPPGLGVPAPTPEDAGKVPMVNPEGDGFIFSALGAGGAGEWELVADVTIEEEITKLQIDKNQDGVPFSYTEMYFIFTLITNDSPGEFWVNNSKMMMTPTKNTTNNLYGFLSVHNNVTLISVRGTNAILSTQYGSYMYHSLRKESEITQFLLTNIRAQAGSTLQVYGR